jgi:L-ascorbate metabolism protein UlaG (beta-lactamase superfamily)/pimeloyl-ACP methyl ester carboxylesterase/sugar lactone lactonase YvrE
MALRIPVAAALLLSATSALAQPGYAPRNDEPNPYQPGVSWGKLPDGRKWGATGGVDIAPDGSVWAYDRCGGNQNGCAASTLPAILHFDTSGRLLGSFGAGLFNFPHGLYVDTDGNVWVTDHGMTPPNGKGNAVYKFSADGTLLLTLGKPGVAGGGPDAFNLPSDVVVGANGDIFVADGHAPGPAARIVKFDKAGTFLKSWGSMGAGEAQLNGPHALAIDSRGRLFVGDRSNNRIQVFDQEGALLASWKQFGRPSGVFIDRDDVLYVTDSESADTPNPGAYGSNPGVKRGIRIGSVRDGKVTAFIPDPSPIGLSSTSEGVAVDHQGAIYGAEVGPRGVKKYIKAAPSQTTVAARDGAITITPFMHASVQIEYGGLVIQVDPAMGDIASAKAADLVLVTDIHEDHLNPARIEKLRKTGAPVVVPAAVQRDAGGQIPAPLEVLANGRTRTVAGITVEAVPMYNLQRKFGDEPFHTKGRGNGYVVTLGGKRLYFAGDTECVPEIKALKNIDVAFLPMNVPFTMPPEETAACAKAFKPTIVVPYHFQGQNTGELVTALNGTGIEVRVLNWYPTVFRPDIVAVARPGALVDVGGRKMHVHCTGSGSPTVVLDAGMNAFALDWQFVQPEIAKTTRVCSYDHAGSGWSDANGPTSTSESVVNDLRAALQAAGERPPYVFVGVSVGAVFGRIYQIRHPDEVAGMVLADADHEDGFLLPLNGKPTPIWSVSAEQLRDIGKQFAPKPGAPPPPMPPPQTDAPYDKLSPAALTTRVTFEMRKAKTMSAMSADEALAGFENDRVTFTALHEANAAQPQIFGHRPLIVLTPENGPDAASKARQKGLTALSANASYRIVPRSGHEIHLYQPEAVTGAIVDVVKAVRDGSKVP